MLVVPALLMRGQYASGGTSRQELLHLVVLDSLHLQQIVYIYGGSRRPTVCALSGYNFQIKTTL